MAAKSPVEIDHQAEYYKALHMPTRTLEKRCARAAAKAGKFLASARAIIEPHIAYFLELRERLNAQGRHGGVRGLATLVREALLVRRSHCQPHAVRHSRAGENKKRFEEAQGQEVETPAMEDPEEEWQPYEWRAPEEWPSAFPPFPEEM